MQNHLQTKESIPAGLLSLAMAFVPTQEFDTPYDPVLAFSRGTIFPALDKPFLGEEAVPQLPTRRSCSGACACTISRSLR